MTISEYEAALQKGMGRCLTEINNKNKEIYKSSILAACLNNISNYLDIEETKGEYLYNLVKKYPNRNYFIKPIMTAYEAFNNYSGDDYNLFLQLTDFLNCLAKEGNKAAINIIKDKKEKLARLLCDIEDNQKQQDIKRVYEQLCINSIKQEGFEGYVNVIKEIDKICSLNTSIAINNFAKVLEGGRLKYRCSRILKKLSDECSQKMYNYFYIAYRKNTSFLQKDNAENTVEITEENTEALSIEKVCLEVAQIIQSTRPQEEQVYSVCKKVIALHGQRLVRRVPKELLYFVYENSPSSYLRTQALCYMGKKKMITKEIAAECLCDSNKAAAGYIKQYHKSFFS